MVEQRCLFCGGDPTEPNHWEYCDGRQGGRDDPAPGYPVDAGWTEPTTSREAAATVDASGLRFEVLTCLTSHGAMTADECAHWLDQSVLTIRPRFSELRALGVIEDTGERHMNTSGRRAAVWKLCGQVVGGLHDGR